MIYPDISTVALDLHPPPMTLGPPAPGKRVRMTAAEYNGTQVHHTLYLPTDWQPQKTYPVLVEYAGNGPYQNAYGDTCSGKVADGNLGYGLSGGSGFLWLTLPYISPDHNSNQLQWWGDVQATVSYCKTVVPRICRQYGGDPAAMVLAGFSRGAIACNYIGLHDDEIAAMWRAFICHSHYDGVRQWGYAADDRNAAAKRVQRLHNRPQFISHETSVAPTQDYLKQAAPQGQFTFHTLPYRNHTDTWTLRDIPLRDTARHWLTSQLHTNQTN